MADIQVAQSTPDRAGWRIWVDRGGTFTDLVAMDPAGQWQSMKLLSQRPGLYDDAVLEGVRRCLGTPRDAPIDDTRIAELRIGTTLATNALLERQGAAVLLVTTAGFGDLLRIGSQHRPDLFALDIHLPEPLFDEVLEVAERIDAQGQVLAAPQREAVLAGLVAARARGLQSCAICFLHSYAFPAHEQQVADWAREAGFTQVSVSSALSPVMRAVPRGQTTVVDASLSPVLNRYVAELAAALPGLVQRPGALSFM